MHFDIGCRVHHLQGPGQVAEVHGAAEPRIGLQQAHDDRHGRLVVAGAARALLRVDHVDADVGVLPCKGTRREPAAPLAPLPPAGMAPLGNTQGCEAQAAVPGMPLAAGGQRRDTGSPQQ